MEQGHGKISRQNLNIVLSLKASGEKKEYAGWALGVAALLAMSSLIPILVGALVHLIKHFSGKNSKHSYDTGKFYRVDTTASTRPMLGDNYEVGIICYDSTAYNTGCSLFCSCRIRRHRNTRRKR